MDMPPLPATACRLPPAADRLLASRWVTAACCPIPSPPLAPQRKKRTHVPESEDPAQRGQPKSFVFRRGRHGAILRDLEKDLRKVRACVCV